MEKNYVIVTVRLESKEIVSMEMFDEASAPPTVKTVVFRMGKDEYKVLGNPPVGEKIKLTLEVSKPPQ